MLVLESVQDHLEPMLVLLEQVLFFFGASVGSSGTPSFGLASCISHAMCSGSLGTSCGWACVGTLLLLWYHLYHRTQTGMQNIVATNAISGSRHLKCEPCDYFGSNNTWFHWNRPIKVKQRQDNE